MDNKDYDKLTRYICDSFDNGCEKCPFYDLEDCDYGMVPSEVLVEAYKIASQPGEQAPAYVKEILDKYYGKATVL